MTAPSLRFGSRVMREWYQYRKRLPLPGEKVVDTVVEVKGDADALAETRIDLGPALKNGKGMVVVTVEPTVPRLTAKSWR